MTAATERREPQPIIEQMQAGLAELRQVLHTNSGLTLEQKRVAFGRIKTLAVMLGLLKRGLRPEGRIYAC
jgi:hypothetical protein